MPIPKKKKREPKAKYLRRLIRHFIHEGYPRKQAIAISINIADKIYEKYTTPPENGKFMTIFAAIT